MRQRPVRSGGSSQPDQMMWVVRSDEGGDGRTKMGTNPDTDHHFGGRPGRCTTDAMHLLAHRVKATWR